MPEIAADAAAKADGDAGAIGPLHGLPVAHSYLLETRGIRTTFGSLLYKDYIPCSLLSALRAGAIIIGKTNTPEFGAGVRRRFYKFSARRATPTTVRRIDWRRRRFACLRLRACGQWLRYGRCNPAAFCNVVGFRPSIPRAVFRTQKRRSRGRR